MSKHVLMIAYHYPPILVSSGVHRTAAFARYLPEFGWSPIVLTAHPRAYQRCDPNYRGDPPGVVVRRAFALDTARHLSLGGHYLRALALPDRWVSWWLGAVASGLALIRRYRPRVIWSTYPIATAHLIGLTLQRLTGLPWVADFRDPMTDEGHPADPSVRKAYLKIERATLSRASRSVFTTEDSLFLYTRRYPRLSPGGWSVIANGYDEEAFARAEKRPPEALSECARKPPVVLVHSGLLYRSERNPEPFFAALAKLRKHGRFHPGNLRIVLRASGDESYYATRLRELNIEDMVSLEAAIPYEAAIREMLSADGLLLFQASNCNHQIPAKVYEYLRARRPILALTDPRGNTAALIEESRSGLIAAIDDEGEIANKLVQFIESIQRGDAPVAAPEAVERHSRKNKALEVARLLSDLS
jgi:glycosyltransferase involved in cell wall biosynthesis